MSTLRIRARVLIFIKKLPDITMEEFDKYWLEEHSKALLKFVKSRGKELGLLKYEQLHVDHAEKAKLKSFGAPALDYDGIEVFEMVSFDSFTALFNDEEYIRDVKSDEAKYLLFEEIIIVRTTVATIIDRGETVDLKPPTKLRQDRSRMLVTFSAIKGVDLSKAWGNHAELVKASPLGQGIIKFDQLYTVGPVEGLTNNPNLSLPNWDGIAVTDVPDFSVLEDAESRRMLAEDTVKWQVQGTVGMLPLHVATIFDSDVAPA